MHRVLAPSRLIIVKALVGQGALSIREVARRVERDRRAGRALRRDHAQQCGGIDRTDKGIEFPYASLHFEFYVSAAA